ETDRAACCCPANQRWHRSRKCTDERGQRRAGFERRVSEDVTRDDGQPEQRAQWVDEHEQVNLREDRDACAEGECFPRRQFACGQRTVCCATHQAVEIAFSVLVECCDSG